MVAKELGMFNEDVVLNDIDVFKPVVMDYALNEGLIQKMQNSASLVVEYKGSEWIGCSKKMKYKIVATDHIGLLNMTTVVFKGDVKNLKEEELGYTMIERFDINSTQCAINTSTLEVVYAPEFIEFLETKQLEITDFSTIGHSLIRVLKKSNEIGGVTVDIEREFSKFIDEDKQFAPYFGETMYQKYKKFEDIFQEFGVEAHEVDFEDKEYPLYKIKRTHNLINNKFAMLKQELGENMDVVTSWKLFKLHSNEQAIKLVRSVIEIENKAFKAIDVYGGVLTNIFVDDKHFDTKKFKYLCESINSDIGYVYLVANNANDFTEALAYADILVEYKSLAERYIFKEVRLQINDDRESKITIQEIIENLDKNNLEELLKTSPSIGESDLKRPKILGIIDNLFITEMEHNDGSIDVFGAAKTKDGLYWEERKLSSSKVIDTFEPLIESYIEADSLKISGEAMTYEDYISDGLYKQPDDSTPQSEEIPF